MITYEYISIRSYIWAPSQGAWWGSKIYGAVAFLSYPAGIKIISQGAGWLADCFGPVAGFNRSGAVVEGYEEELGCLKLHSRNPSSMTWRELIRRYWKEFSNSWKMTYLSDRFWWREYLTAKKHTINSRIGCLKNKGHLFMTLMTPPWVEMFPPMVQDMNIIQWWTN